MKVKILYEDKDILAIDKPAGISVHENEASKKNNEKTVIDFLVKKYPKIELVHRLDKDTSGVLLFAKNKKAHEFLKKQFSGREIKKVYHAVVSGYVKNDHGIINKPIGRSPSDFRRRLAGRGVRGAQRESITEYKVLKRFMDKDEEKFSYLEVKPKTGRTHQIRVHMKFLNHPVACDSLYAPNNPCPPGFSRLALHAKSIEFKNLGGKNIKVESPLPKEFKLLNSNGRKS
jgi:23S rRNA pseudouridine1911/1915/1917 synthase